MLLEPGGYITPHADQDINRLSPVNIALNTPKNCLFKMKGHNGFVPLTDGKAVLLDVGNIHAVYNKSDEDRFHIIVHGVKNKEYEDLVERSYAKNGIE
jgi:aspartyl/asparaginyl beta-hydroxylase (cupin superfamily)